MTDMFSDVVTLREMIAEAERELKMRLGAYPRFVAMGRMTEAKAERALAVQRAIIAKLKEIGG